MKVRHVLLLGLAVLSLALAERAIADEPQGPAGGSEAPAFAQGPPDPSSPGYTGERPVEMERRVQRSRFRYLMLGYGVIWVCLGVYMFGLHRRVAGVGREIGELRARLEETDASARRR